MDLGTSLETAEDLLSELGEFQARAKVSRGGSCDSHVTAVCANYSMHGAYKSFVSE